MKLPPEDRTLSPHTGYARAHWVAVADGLLDAAWRWASPGKARLDLPGPASASGVRSDGLEGFARTFLAAAFRVAGDGDPHNWLERYAAGLDAGTRTPGRDDAESWPVILGHDVAGQPMVESASVALGLRLTRPWLWDRLDSRTQDRVEAWLRGALRHTPAPNNWYLFPFTVAGFLDDVGRGDAETARARDRALELLEGWYRGDGWYADGDGRAFDYYNGWALHLYPVLDAHLAGKPAHHGERLREHLNSLRLWFGADGAPLHFGRSLTYRFAAVSAIGLGAVTGDTPLRPGLSRRLLSGALKYFLDRGAVDDRGILSLGWHGPHPPTTQFYSGPGSPYWASKAFACLLAPADHPLWTSTEESDDTDTIRAEPAPGFLLQKADGVVRLHNHGSDHLRPHEAESADDPHYSRFAYSTCTGPTAKDNAADNHFAVVAGGVRSVRRRIHPLGAGQGDGWGWAASWHRPIFKTAAVPGLRVESVTVARGRDEVRVHRVVGAPPGATVEQTGWAAESVLKPLSGWTGQDEVRAPHGTAYTPWVSLPRLTGDLDGTTVFIAHAVLGTEATDLDVTEEGIRWPDGFTVRITFDPLEVTAG
ncbi:DUF2264 domain-containing protein [Amycolatopsis sp., V23-08]|uniref:DUF2264 domain-containing protein n=1 Tax=Amycolatopsis heterodermiae TaxID=3110235 RepID=A0ABU5RN67_9PSEU|nr:DUF2264 domain-containing protein [Amycolatopsis sp., V23-08]MEA5367653.1 DUF2264 domain-containing protein [Amycolatopsis sp., V23-08]